MPEIVITDVEDEILERLERRASIHGRSAEDEAKAILVAALPAVDRGVWSAVDAIRNRLAATDRAFGDSVDDVREDRER